MPAAGVAADGVEEGTGPGLGEAELGAAGDCADGGLVNSGTLWWKKLGTNESRTAENPHSGKRKEKIDSHINKVDTT